ncbi:MAG: RES family NAD+ phosphorylase [Ferruginibacter sp.]|nr:RES family NAD+ phosphorylase [Cytophagales bacterium]
MEVYRICLEKWSARLSASGQSARWNSRGKYVVYTAQSRALACLENVVHRSGEGLNALFRVMVIEIPAAVSLQEVDPAGLPDDWPDYARYTHCQAIGDRWLAAGTTAVLRVPSAIIARESNFLINPAHPDFGRIHLVAREDFRFDPRIKSV